LKNEEDGSVGCSTEILHSPLLGVPNDVDFMFLDSVANECEHYKVKKLEKW